MSDVTAGTHDGWAHVRDAGLNPVGFARAEEVRRVMEALEKVDPTVAEAPHCAAPYEAADRALGVLFDAVVTDPRNQHGEP